MTTGNGAYNNCAIWSPTCPPNPIPLGDTVIIQHNIGLVADLDIEGVLIIDSLATLSGNHEIKILPSGTVYNNGAINITDEMHVDGSLYNSGYIFANEIHSDGYICNSGTIEIWKSIDISDSIKEVIIDTKSGQISTSEIITAEKIATGQTVDVFDDSDNLNFIGQAYKRD